MKQLSRLTALAFAGLAFAVLAHGGMEHFKGVVAKIDGTVITLTTEKGAAVVILTDAKTELTRGTTRVALKDLAVGDKVVIHAIEHDEHLVARVVKLAPATAADGGAAKPDQAHDHAH